MKSDKKKNQEDLNPVVKNEKDIQKAGYGGRDIPNRNSKNEEE
ncbi:hypothetical protein [Aequorivita echinoideorum]|nr:hypothetical protein [Aequorivita echinoideorum]